MYTTCLASQSTWNDMPSTHLWALSTPVLTCPSLAALVICTHVATSSLATLGICAHMLTATLASESTCINMPPPCMGSE